MNWGFEREQTPQEILEWRNRLSAHLTSHPDECLIKSFDRWVSDEVKAQMAFAVGNQIRDADVVIWPKNLSDRALGQEYAKARMDISLPLTAPQFWVMNWDSNERSIVGVLLIASNERDRLLYSMIGAFKGEDFPRMQSGWIFIEQELDETGMLIAKAWDFLGSRVTVSERPLFNRAARRQLERQDIDYSKIQVITLRKGEPHEPKGTRQVEWSCQWDVRPFYGIRHTKEGPKRVLISGHRKGPEGKPLKERGEVVSIVKR